MKTLVFSLLISALLILSACNNSKTDAELIEQADTPLNQVSLKPVESCPALKEKLVHNWVENLLAYQRYSDDLIIDLPIETLPGEGLNNAVGDVADSAPDDVSQTNTQEAGVDEADRVKTDSQGNMYIAQHDKLVIADAWPADSMNILSILNLGGSVSGLYLSEQDSVIVALVRAFLPILAPVAQEQDSLAPYIWRNPKTDLVFIDISDPADPSVLRKIRLGGHLINSRASNGRIHLVQGFYLERYLLAQSDEVQDLLTQFHQAFENEDEAEMLSSKDKLATHISLNLDINDIRALLPSLQNIFPTGQEPEENLSCDAVYAPIIDTRDNHLLVVSSVDFSGDNLQRAAALGSGWIVYASQQDLFIVQSGFSWWWRPHQLQQSAIHHFAISTGKPAYISTGLVKGYVNNAFSLSFYDEHLRVATTQNFWNLSDRSDIRSTNHLFVLKDNERFGMDSIGSVNNYADNERIFSARFIKDRGFVVTFRQVDPLFSFDLSDPANPLIAGELKIPGFSTYMHPIDDTHLLTIGRDGNENGINNQVAIKLFDVSDLANPTLLDSYTPELGDGYSWSQANWDYHAFTYYQPEQLLAIPLSSYHSTDDNYFMGMLVLNVDTTLGLSLAGTLDHEDLLDQISCSSSFDDCNKYYYRWLAQPTRSVFMTRQDESYLYSLSNIGLKALSTDDYDTTVGSLLLPSPEIYYDLIY